MTSNPFRVLWDRGYRRLLPVLPYTEATKHVRMAGKRPAVLTPEGWWQGMGAKNFDATTEDDLDVWYAMGAGVGVRCDRDVLGVDVDVLSPEWSKRIVDMALEDLGPGVVRVGRAPKTMLVYQTYDIMSHPPVRFDDGTEGGGLVELQAGEAKWFVMHGIHPKTGRKYTWPNDVPQKAALPFVTRAQIDKFFTRLEAELPKSKGKGLSAFTDRSKVDQDVIKAPPDRLEALADIIRKLPNVYATVGGYEPWVWLAAAMRGAFQDDPDLGCDAFVEFSENGDVADPEEDPERVYKSLHEPFALGYSYLIGFIATASARDENRSISTAPLFFEPPVDDATVASDGEVLFPEARPEAADVFPLLTLGEIVSRPPPAMLIARHIPAVSLGFLYSVPGAGKSFIAQDIGLHIATALAEWHGDGISVDPEAVVLYIAAEGSYGLRNRVRAWAKQHNVPTLPDRFLVIEQTIDFMSAEDIDKLLRTVRTAAGRRPCLIVVDTVSRAMPGADENLQKEMTLFVRACDRLRDAFRCAVLGVHHAGKNGDMRGSTVLLGAGDFVFRLDRQAGRTIGHLHCEKQKDAADGWSEPYAFNTVALDDGESSLVVSRAAVGFGPATELTPSMAGQVLGAMRAAWVAGEPWGKTYHAKDRYAVKRMVREFGFEAAQAEELLSVWEGSGIIKESTASAKSKIRGYQVLADVDNLSGNEAFESVFD